MATGIRDRVAILGMGCSKFGERWNDNAEDLMHEAFGEALADAGIEKDRIEAAWLSTAIEEQHAGKSGIPLAIALRLPYIPVTRVENYCASGSEAFRGAVYAVASGACDIALALGVEKLKDTGYGGLPQRTRGTVNDLCTGRTSPPPVRSRSSRRRIRARHELPAEDLQAGDGPRLGQEPRQRIEESESASAQPDRRGSGAERAHGRGAAWAVRLLRGIRRLSVRHRDHPRDRAFARQDGSRHREGASALGLERDRGPAQLVGRELLHDHPQGVGACIQGGGNLPIRARS